jgi:hypothetical protein
LKVSAGIIKMLIFMGFILFCLVFQVFVFVIILPIIQRITSKEIPSDELPILSLILLIPSLWIYIQIVLLAKGEIEQIQYNIFNLFPSNAIQLSLKYNTPGLLFFLFLLLIVSIFFYSKVKYFRKNIITKLLFMVILFYNLYRLPFIIVDNHNESIQEAREFIIRKKQEAEEVEKAPRRSYNSSVLDEYKAYYMGGRGVYLFFPSYSRCIEGYPVSEGELSCEKTKSFCTQIRSLYKDDVNAEYLDMLESAKSYCRREGWDKSK